MANGKYTPSLNCVVVMRLGRNIATLSYFSLLSKSSAQAGGALVTRRNPPQSITKLKAPPAQQKKKRSELPPARTTSWDRKYERKSASYSWSLGLFFNTAHLCTTCMKSEPVSWDKGPLGSLTTGKKTTCCCCCKSYEITHKIILLMMACDRVWMRDEVQLQ